MRIDDHFVVRYALLCAYLIIWDERTSICCACLSLTAHLGLRYSSGGGHVLCMGG